MSTPLPYRSNLSAIGILFFALLTVLALFFYRERTIMPDTGFQLFEMLRHDHVAVQIGRYGAVLNQLFPLLAIKMGGSVQLVLISYSLSFIFWPLVIFLILIFLLRSIRMGLVSLLFSGMMVVHTFFWIQSELITSCLLLLLAWGFMYARNGPARWHWSWLAPVLGVALTTHPLAIIPHLYIALFFWWEKGWAHRPDIWRFAILGPVLLLAKFIFFSVAAYDLSSYGLSENAFLRFYRFFSWRSTHRFILYCFTDYLLYAPLAFGVIFFYWKNKNQKKLLLFLGFTMGYLVLVNGTFYWGGVQFHLEAFYQVLALFLAFPLVFDVLPMLSKRRASIALSVILIHSLIQIGIAARQYRNRTDWTMDLISENRANGRHKIVLDPDTLPMDTLILEWGLPYEAALLSSLENLDTTFSVAVDLPDSPVGQLLERKKAFVHTFGQISYQDLNRLPYFCFRDTSRYLRVTPGQ